MFRFSRFALDPSCRELRKDGATVEIQPQALALLAHLVKHPGRVVSKDELIDAVWKGQAVSDEVIARAVMKVRRAIDDDARAPRHLFTEAGRGYRFSLSPSAGPVALGTAATAAPPALASPPPSSAGAIDAVWHVLPFVNRSNNPALDWGVTGLQRLLHHAMETASDVTAVTSDSAARDELHAGLPASRIARVTAQRPNDRVVAGDIDEGPDGFVLSLAWHLPGRSVRTLVLDGPDLPSLVLRTAAHLAPPAPWQAEVARDHPQAWARLNESIAHLGRWPRHEVADRLERCYAALPRLPRLRLQQAELLVQLAEFERAEAVAWQVRADLGDDPTRQEDLESTLSALVLANEATKRRGDLPLAEQRLALALAFVARHEDRLRPSRHLAMLWQQAAFLAREAGNVTAAIGHLDRAILIAVRSGLQDIELRYRAALAQLLGWQGEPHRADETLRRVISRAEDIDNREAMAIAMAAVGGTAQNQGRLADSLYWSQKALAVALASTRDYVATANSRATLIEAQLFAGRLDAAERSLQWHRRHRPTGTSAIYEIGLLSKNAWLSWRQGRLVEAADAYARVLQDARLGAWVKWANHLRADHAVLLSLLGRTDEARRSLAMLTNVAPPAVVGRARAAIAMSEGQPAEAHGALKDLMPLLRPGEPDVYQVAIDFCWLLLDTGDAAEAELMLDRCIAMESDHIGIRWIQLALQERIGSAVDPAEWEALRQESPSLLRHCPALGTPEDVQSRRAGRARALPNLLTALAF